MKKRSILLLSLLTLISIGSYKLYENYLGNSVEKKMEYKIEDTNLKLPPIPSENNTNININNASIGKEKVITPDINYDNTKDNNFDVVVKSPLYNALVSLDESSKEVNIKLIEDVSAYTKDSIKHYINLDNEDINYLVKNADTLLNQFKSGSLIEKYTLVTDMLKNYDTNINQGDLIGIGLSLLK